MIHIGLRGGTSYTRLKGLRGTVLVPYRPVLYCTVQCTSTAIKLRAVHAPARPSAPRTPPSLPPTSLSPFSLSSAATSRMVIMPFDRSMEGLIKVSLASFLSERACPVLSSTTCHRANTASLQLLPRDGSGDCRGISHPLSVKQHSIRTERPTLHQHARA